MSKSWLPISITSIFCLIIFFSIALVKKSQTSPKLAPPSQTDSSQNNNLIPEDLMIPIKQPPNTFLDKSDNQQKPIILEITSSNAQDEVTGQKFDYELTQNSFKTYFKNDIKHANLATVKKPLYTFAEKLVEAQIAYTLEPSPDFGSPAQSQAIVKNNTTTYPSVFPGIDLRFTVKADQLLEEFIVYSPVTASKITKLPESFSSHGLKYEKKFDGSIVFTSIATNEVVFIIPKPVMYELNDRSVESYALHYEINEIEGKYILSKVIDPEGYTWMADPARQYPIAIDATTVDSSTSSLATAYSFQRKTWHDGTRYWLAFHSDADNRIEFWYSTDGYVWTENTTARLSIDSNDFSIEADSSYFYIAYTNGYDIEARSGSSYPGTGFSLSAATVVYNGSSVSDAYRYPTITKDSNSKLWIGAVSITGTTSSYYAVDDVNEGYIGGSNASYTTAHSTSTSSTLNNLLGYRVGQLLTGGVYYIYRSYTIFDTSGIPDTTDILASNIYLYAYQDSSGSNDFDVHIYRYSYPTPISSNREEVYDEAFGSSAIFEGTLLNTSGMSINTYYNMSVNTASINLTGNTQYSIVGSRDVSSLAATGTEYVYFYGAEQTGTTLDPYLYITYGNYAFMAVQSTNANNITAWQTASTVDASSTNSNKYGVLVPRTSGNIYAVWIDGAAIEGKLYNGSAWDASPTSIATGVSGLTTSLSAVSDSSGNVHLLYIDSNNYAVYREYTSSWQTPVTLDANSGNTYPSISFSSSDNSVYAFWIRNSHIYYKRGVSTYISGSWDASATDWIGSNTNIWLTTNYSGSGNIYALWTGGSSSLYTTYWGKLSQTAPTTCTLALNPNNSAITINWNDLNSTETGYTIEKSTDGGAFASLTTTAANATSYENNSSVSTGHTYAYRIKAAGAVDSEWCVTATLTLGSGAFKFEGLKMEGIKID